MPKTSRLLACLDEALAEIYQLGLLRAPAEACGLLLDMPWLRSDGRLSYVIELPNRTLATSGQYLMEPKDMAFALEGYNDVEDVAVWHTHPSGFIGPSEGDLIHRPSDDVKMFVVSLTREGPIATWF